MKMENGFGYNKINLLFEGGPGDKKGAGPGDKKGAGPGDKKGTGPGDKKGTGPGDKKGKDPKSDGNNEVNASTFPRNKKEGDEFRAWMKQTNPSFKCDDGTSLLEKGSFNNSCIKKALNQFKSDYIKFIGSKGTVVVGSGSGSGSGVSSGGFPINTLALSNMFRDYVNDNHSGYLVRNTDFLNSITDASKIADEPLKKAWLEYGNEYIDYLIGRSNTILSDLGSQLKTDNKAWEKSSDAKLSGLDLQNREQEFEKKKCQPWEANNLIKKYLPSKGDNELNNFAESFVEWSDENGYIDFHLPSQYCGESKTDIQWVYQDWKDENGITYQPYEHPIVRFLSLIPMWVYDDTRGVDVKSNLFNKFLKSTKTVVTQKSNSTTQRTPIVAPVQNIPVTDSRLKAASDNVKRGINKQNCKTLSSEVDRVKYNRTDKDVNNEIGRCKIFFKNTFKENIENKITGKLKLMKENKSLSESITNKIKSKKNQKTLGNLTEQFDKQNYRKFFDSLNKLKNNSINEATNLEFEKSFDVIFKGKEKEFKDRAKEYILNKLEVSPTSELGMNIKSELDKVPAKEMFTNEYDISEAVAKAIESSTQSNTEEQTGLKRIVNQSFNFDQKKIKQGVRQHLQDYVEGVKEDIKSLEQKLKSSIIKDL